MSDKRLGFGYQPLGLEMSELGPPSRAPSYASEGYDASFKSNDDKKFLIRQTSSFLSNGLLDDFPTRHGSSIATPRQRRHRFTSWKVGVATSALTTTAVLVTNCILLIWASVHFGLDDGMGTALEGDCETVASWSLWLHIVINALSSVLLGASNYTMQWVASPTRSECDRAHAKGKWMDIGVPSLKNLTKISWQRRILWALLGLSSIPIHLLYNSAVFKTLDSNAYSATLISPSFLESTERVSYWKDNPAFDVRDYYATNATAFDHLSPEECVATYAAFFLSGHSDVLVVTSQDDDDDDRGGYITSWDAGELETGTANSVSYDWICPDQRCPDPAGTHRYGKDWTLKGEVVDHCLALKAEPHCMLQFSASILTAVVVCNLIKVFAMVWTLWQQRETTFVTFDDALSNWLDDPDESTKGRCLESKDDMSKAPRMTQTPAPRQAFHRPRRWRQAISRTRLTVTLAFCIAGIATVCALLGLASGLMANQVYDNIFDTGFGVADGRMLLQGFSTEGSAGLASAVLIANAPQLTLSLIYLLYNALFTGMHLAHEYGQYAAHRKPLRVTTPFGQQRKTYWLSLPYAYSIPLMITSTTLHWLISQAVFLVRVKRQSSEFSTRYGYEDVGGSFAGFSPAAMLAVVIVGSAATLVAVGMGYRRLGGGCMPVAASCSLAIAAAAHRPEGDVDAAVLPVKWGEAAETRDADVGHCCFTSQEVVDVVPGRFYAGIGGS